MSATPAVQAWVGRAAWSVLDCAFGNGQHLLAVWSAWLADPQRPRMLHYVVIANGFTDLESAHPFSAALNASGKNLQPGFNRIALEGGQLSLTLCLGPASDMLDAQAFQADHIFVDALTDDKWSVKALARCCKRGTRVSAAQADMDSLPAPWTDAGFKPADTAASGAGPDMLAVYDPDWVLKRTRHASSTWEQAPGQCVVIGAGLSGASVARALALRGWQVTVLDQSSEPAGGASGLPVGLVVPNVSADDNPRSRLSRAGARMTLAQARVHLQTGADWAPSGVTELRLNPITQQREPLWHATAGWIKPAALVHAWLQTPGITFQGSTPVARLDHCGNTWQLLDHDDHTVAQAELVVLANAIGCRGLLQDMPLPPDLATKLKVLHLMHGTVTLGPSTSDPTFPATPVNGLGSFVPHVPSMSGAFWAAGATFEPDAAALADTAHQHALNQQRLGTLLPKVASTLEKQFASSQVTAWSGGRCVTHDRLPWVGPVDIQGRPGLWVCAGMGSRGLSYSVLCAELLAARLGGEPLPLEAQLLRSLDIKRPPSRHLEAQAATLFVASRRSAGD